MHNVLLLQLLCTVAVILSPGQAAVLGGWRCPPKCNPKPDTLLRSCIYSCGWFKIGKYYDGSPCWIFGRLGKLLKSTGRCSGGVCLWDDRYSESDSERICGVMLSGEGKIVITKKKRKGNVAVKNATVHLPTKKSGRSSMKTVPTTAIKSSFNAAKRSSLQLTRHEGSPKHSSRKILPVGSKTGHSSQATPRHQKVRESIDKLLPSKSTKTKKSTSGKKYSITEPTNKKAAFTITKATTHLGTTSSKSQKSTEVPYEKSTTTAIKRASKLTHTTVKTPNRNVSVSARLTHPSIIKSHNKKTSTGHGGLAASLTSIVRPHPITGKIKTHRQNEENVTAVAIPEEIIAHTTKSKTRTAQDIKNYTRRFKDTYSTPNSASVRAKFITISPKPRQKIFTNIKPKQLQLSKTPLSRNKGRNKAAGATEASKKYNEVLKHTKYLRKSPDNGSIIDNGATTSSVRESFGSEEGWGKLFENNTGGSEKINVPKTMLKSEQPNLHGVSKNESPDSTSSIANKEHQLEHLKSQNSNLSYEIQTENQNVHYVTAEETAISTINAAVGVKAKVRTSHAKQKTIEPKTTAAEHKVARARIAGKQNFLPDTSLAAITHLQRLRAADNNRTKKHKQSPAKRDCNHHKCIQNAPRQGNCGCNQ